MIKINKISIFAGIFLLLACSSLPAFSATSTTMSEVLGTDFSNDFGLVLDFNIDGSNPADDLAPNIQVLQDLGNSSNTKVVSEDLNEWYDQQYFFSHFNVEGVDNIYLALNKMEFNITMNILGKSINFGHVNGSAPFQSLIQYFKYMDKDVLVANTFRGLMAYSTSDTDPTIDPTDEVLFGYSFVEQHLIDLLNTALTGHGFDTIPQYGFEPIYNEADHTFGMIYTNYFVVWQKTNPTPPSALQSFAGKAFENVVTGGDMVAASLFDYLKFSYKVQVNPSSNATHKIVDVETTYDLGPMKWLITRDDLTTYNAIKAGVSTIDSTNSFNRPTSDIDILLTQVTPNILVKTSIPELSFYTGAAVEQRINTHAMKDIGETGFGVAVATSTNAYVVGEIVKDTDSNTDTQDITVPLSFNNSTFYETNFVGKSSYSREFTNGTVEKDLPVYISTRSLAQISELMDVSSLISTYFKLQSIQTYGITVFSARQLNPTRFASSSSSNLHLTVETTSYVTLVQMPKWSGLKVTQDPTFSAVAAVSQNTSGTSNSSTVKTGVPGFEVYLLVTVIPLITLRKKLNKNK
jgi:hypothetical protein